ncbi:MAG TPA: tetratricopeptide repeat protein [Rudaea sp.]|nr:tetratricopeptide repeat protein [Rudaea sp.]
MKKSGAVHFVLCTGTALLLAAHGAAAASKKDEKTHYPNATRSEPKNDMTSSTDQKNLNQGLDALNSGDDAKAKELLHKVIETSKSKYAQGYADLGLANLELNDADYKSAIADYKKVLELNSVPNDAYFDSMFNLVNAYVGDEQYQAALDELKIWREQGKRETADSYALEGNIDYRLEKYPEAIEAIKKAQSMTNEPKESWNSILMASYAQSGQSSQAAGLIEQQLAKEPTNKKLIQNALVIYTQNNQDDKALALLDKERSQGLITDESDYVTAAKIYANIAQSTDSGETNGLKAASLLQEGLTKGAVKPTAENYKLLGDVYMIAGNNDKALDAYNKAAPLASNGDLDYRRAQILGAAQNYAEAKTAIQKAISRGVTHKGKAYVLLGKIDLGLKDKAGAKAAFQQALQDPDAKSDASDELKKLGGGK